MKGAICKCKFKCPVSGWSKCSMWSIVSRTTFLAQQLQLLLTRVPVSAIHSRLLHLIPHSRQPIVLLAQQTSHKTPSLRASGRRIYNHSFKPGFIFKPARGSRLAPGVPVRINRKWRYTLQQRKKTVTTLSLQNRPFVA